MYKSKRAKATAISPKVKKAVWERDGERCIYCGSPYANPEAHVISRQKGGLGVEKNIVTLCRSCHRRFDSGTNHERIMMKKFIESYLRKKYGYIKKEDVTYFSEWKRWLNARKND